jgi:hypothetical protein
MLDKTVDQPVSEKELGIGVQFAAAVGNNRQMTLTCGVPLDWPQEKLNGLLDRLASAADRQAAKGKVEELKLTIENARRQLLTNRQQLENYELSAQNDWEIGKRKGVFQPTESQKKQMQNFKNNDAHLVEQIKKFEADLVVLEAQCR